MRAILVRRGLPRVPRRLPADRLPGAHGRVVRLDDRRPDDGGLPRRGLLVERGAGDRRRPLVRVGSRPPDGVDRAGLHHVDAGGDAGPPGQVPPGRRSSPTSARIITWGWLAIYAAVPVAMVVGAGAAGSRRRPGRRRRSRTPSAAARTAVAARRARRGPAGGRRGPARGAGEHGRPVVVAADAADRARRRRLAGRAWAGPPPTPGSIDDVDSVQPLGTHRGGVRRARGGGPRAVRRRAGLVELAGSRLPRRAGLDRLVALGILRAAGAAARGRSR